MSKTWSDSLRYLVLTALVIFALAFVYYIRAAFAPLIVASLIAYLMNPIADWIAKIPRISRKASVNIVFFSILAILIAIPSFFLPGIIREIETFSNDLRDIYGLFVNFISTPIHIMELTFEPQIFLPGIEEIPFLDVGFLTGEAVHLVEAITLNTLWFLVILASSYFLLLDWGKIKKFILSLTPKDFRSDFRRLYQEITEIWDGYLRGNLILMFITSIIFIIAWSIIGLPAGILLGLLMGLLKIIPDVGPMFAAGISILVAFLEGSNTFDIPNIWFAVLVFVIYFILINIITIWLRSFLFGRSVHMHSGLVFILIMVSVIIQGILGAVIVIPLVASAFIVFRYILRKIYKLPSFSEEVENIEKISSEENNVKDLKEQTTI